MKFQSASGERDARAGQLLDLRGAAEVIEVAVREQDVLLMSFGSKPTFRMLSTTEVDVTAPAPRRSGSTPALVGIEPATETEPGPT